MKVQIINDTLVRVKKGEVIEVEETEGRRLMAFKNAVEVKESTKKKGAAK